MSVTRERLSELRRAIPWVPQPGPQFDAFVSPADQLGYGGSAGGGKTFLAILLARLRHRRTLFIRREGVQLQPVIDELERMIGSRTGYNSQKGVWRFQDGRQVQFGGVPNPGDETKYQGNPRDLLVLDEAVNLLESQARFLMGWVRTTEARQRTRVLLSTNPPTSAEGEWFIRWFAPWLDPYYAKPARPGELRWVAMVDGTEVWVDGPEPFLHKGELLQPVSRTFIPSRVTDNRYLVGTNYERQLQALPEPLRSQMLKGDFTAGRRDDEWQVIPSAWVKAAMERWKPTKDAGQVTSVGVDPSRGSDEATIAPRRGWRYDELVVVQPDATGLVRGGAVAKRVLDVAGPAAPVHLDVIGVGASAYDHLEAFVGARAVAVNVALPSSAKDLSGKLGFVNLRAELWWRFREILAPENPARVALPPDARLQADLCAPHYKVTARGIQIEEKPQIVARLGRSPDRAEAVVLASMRTPVVLDNHSGQRTVVRRALGSR